jgi:dynein heavy chain, axonemal
MTPPSGGNNPVDPRFMSLFSVFNITFPDANTIQNIYTTILNKYLDNYSSTQKMKNELKFVDDMSQTSSKLTIMTLELLEQIKERLPRTPIKFHYIFNLRDLSRIYEGLCQLTPDKFPNSSKTTLRIKY